MFPFLAEFRSPRRVRFAEASAELLELMVGHIDVPASFDRAPALLKLRSVCFWQMRFGVALHMDNAKLDIGVGKQAGGNRQQTAKVVMDDDHDATETAFNQPTKYQLPIFEILTAGSSQTGED